MSAEASNTPSVDESDALVLRLAVVSSCTPTQCDVIGLDGDTPMAASYSALMVKHNIRVQPGQLVAVDWSSVPPRVVYRWEDIDVVRADSGYTLAEDGTPVDPDRVGDEFFPKIRAIFAQDEEMGASINWIDVSSLSFNTLLLLERVQLSWFPGWLPETELAIALSANPVVAWYMRHKCPGLSGWLDEVIARRGEGETWETVEVRRAEEVVMGSINDLLTYVVNPTAYDAQPFLGWDDQELVSLVDFSGKMVIDIGSGTGRLALVAAEEAVTVYAVEPVANLRAYIKAKARRLGLQNVYVVDGLITDLPFSDGFADVTMGGHVFGDQPEEEYSEMVRVTKPGGMVILCPGGADRESDRHRFLTLKGFEWSQFEEPGEGFVRKYWKTV